MWNRPTEPLQHISLDWLIQAADDVRKGVPAVRLVRRVREKVANMQLGWYGYKRAETFARGAIAFLASLESANPWAFLQACAEQKRITDLDHDTAQALLQLYSVMSKIDTRRVFPRVQALEQWREPAATEPALSRQRAGTPGPKRWSRAEFHAKLADALKRVPAGVCNQADVAAAFDPRIGRRTLLRYLEEYGPNWQPLRQSRWRLQAAHNLAQSVAGALSATHQTHQTHGNGRRST